MLFDGARISDSNIRTYTDLELAIYKHRIYNIRSLLQKDYGEDNDCTITSISAIIHQSLITTDINYIYSVVETIARKFGYRSWFGTPNLTIGIILKKSLQYFNIDKFNVKSHYLKNTGYDYELIKKNIDEGKPVLLNLWKDGRNYYKNHTVLIVGYYRTQSYKMLMIYDNWSYGISYIDYDKLSNISSIQTL